MQKKETINNDLLLPESIREGLETKIFGKKEIHHFTETDSTNLRAEKLAATGAPEGTLVLAEKQTSGRGRAGRDWFSESRDGIYFSIILRPELAPAKVQGVTLMTAVAAYEALMGLYDLPLSIKWPNDILINGKKTAGILTTMETKGVKVSHIVVGIGINVNTDISSLPGEIRDIATSLSHESGIRNHRSKVLRAFLESFEGKYMLFTGGKFQEIVDAWIHYSGLSGKCVEITLADKIIEGNVTGIDNNGYLLIESRTGHRHKIISGEITKISGSL
jgi:BirA family biotin operon repressor/biotin-[acetyl-CoA-carboxylase] ligase